MAERVRTPLQGQGRNSMATFGRHGSRCWLALAAVLALPLLAGCSVLEGIDGGGDEADGSVDEDLNRGPFLFDVSPTTATIGGVAHVPLARQARDAAGVSLDISPEAAVTDTSTGTDGSYWFELTNLSPSTLYTYVVELDGEASSETYSFRTASQGASSTRMAVFGDTRDNPSVLASLAELIQSWDPDLVIHVGDYVGDDKANEWQEQWYVPTQHLTAQYWLLPVQGNHEEDSREYAAWLGRERLRSDTLLDGSVYSEVCGLAWVGVLNANHRMNEGSAQYGWLEDQLESAAARNAAWRIVAVHEPPFHSSTKHQPGNEDVADDLLPLLKQNDVRLLVTGHVHAYERLQDDSLTILVTGAGGAPLHNDRISSPPPQSQVFVTSTYESCFLTLTETALAATVETPTGTQIDSFVIER